MQRDDGSWEAPTIVPDVGLTAATCYSVMALRAAGLSSGDDSFSRACRWLEGVIASDGGVTLWCGPTTTHLVSSALTLQCLVAVDEARYSTRISAILQWFRTAQNADGGFGSKPRTTSTLHHTALAVMALCCIPDREAAWDVVQRGRDYLLKHWSLGQNIYRDIFYVEHTGRRAMLPHTYQTDGLLLQAELASADGSEYERLGGLVEHVVATQVNGYWIHESIPDMIPSWAIMECVLGLRKFRSLMEKQQGMVELKSSVKQMSRTIKAIEGSITSRNADLEKQGKRIDSLFAIYKYRHLIAILYLFSIYMFVRANFGSYQRVTDIIAVLVGVLVGSIQVMQAIKK
jgi:hypothetical protein